LFIFNFFFFLPKTTSHVILFRSKFATRWFSFVFCRSYRDS
jgi:hypothetical protein